MRVHENLRAWLLAICCCCRRHATAPTHHISRPSWRLALVVLVRGELYDFLNPELSEEARLAVFSKQRFFNSLESKSSAFPTATNRRRNNFLQRNAHYCIQISGNSSSAARSDRTGKCAFWRARAVIFHVPKRNKNTDSIIQSCVSFTEPHKKIVPAAHRSSSLRRSTVHWRASCRYDAKSGTRAFNYNWMAYCWKDSGRIWFVTPSAPLSYRNAHPWRRTRHRLQVIWAWT